MKKLLFGVLILLIASCGRSSSTKRMYCGTVIEKGKEEPTSGYKSSSDARYFIVFKRDTCNQAIRVNVTVPTYYSTEIGKPVCFELDGWSLYGAGNITYPSDTLRCY
jgi:hypothetical protein